MTTETNKAPVERLDATFTTGGLGRPDELGRPDIVNHARDSWRPR